MELEVVSQVATDLVSGEAAGDMPAGRHTVVPLDALDDGGELGEGEADSESEPAMENVREPGRSPS
jgi:hypothetical protein